jgi:hypothetical protein
MRSTGSFRHALLLAGALLAPAPALAAESLETRIATLEQQLAELKALVKAQPTATATAATPTPAITETAKKAEPAALPAVSTASGAKLQFYGFARFDASWDSGRITPGNIAMYVPSEATVNDDSEWNLTASATRIGMNLSGPDTETMKLTGNIEFDFLSGTVENASNPRLRHGYLKAYWPKSDFSILAGQTWDLVGSLIPFVDDPAIMWDAGNIGGRHPQLRFTKGFKAGDNGRIEAAIAASRKIGETDTFLDPTKKINITDTGKDAAMPSIQGRLALLTPLFVAEKPATVAVSGHYGQEEWDIATNGTHETLDSWSCVLELSFPISQRITLASELFTGENLDDYWGGIGQGVNMESTTSLQSVNSHGGWVALRYAATPETSLSLGAGLDDPDNGDLPSPSATVPHARTFNETQFIAVTHRIAPNFILGTQLSRWKTEYKDEADGDAVRAQTSLTYLF